MSRPRFQKLPTEQQDAILDAALDEFAARGFAGSSLNRIIEVAGISKGSMYYYFDGKEDLYAHVIRAQLERLLAASGPMPVPESTDVDAFWASITTYYLHTMRMLADSPKLAGLLRGWLSGPVPPMSEEAQRDAEQAIAPWLARTVARGQAIGAVRTDLPTELLIAIALGLAQASDTWLVTRPPAADELETTISTLMSVMRRALEP